MSAAKIVSDSACDLASTDADSLGVTVVPLAIRFGETEYVDRLELSNERFWELAKASSELPSTAAPSPGAFEDAYRAAAAAGSTSVVVITLSSKLSATFQSATKAAEAVSGTIDVRVIDSETCAVAQGTLCRMAAEMAQEGASADEIVTKIEELKRRTHLIGTLDTLENLKKGGRIGAAGAFFAALLSVKPVITIEDGEVKPLSRQRTRKRSIEHLVSLVAQAGTVERVSVTHSQAPDVNDLATRLRELTKQDVPVNDIGPVIGTHGGPGLLAVSFLTVD